MRGQTATDPARDDLSTVPVTSLDFRSVPASGQLRPVRRRGRVPAERATLAHEVPAHLAHWHARIHSISESLEARWQKHARHLEGDDEVEALRTEWADARVGFENALAERLR